MADHLYLCLAKWPLRCVAKCNVWFYVKLQTNLAGGTAADLLWLSQEYIAPYASKGVLLDITDQLGTDRRPAAKSDDYFANILQTAQYDGRT